MVEGSRARIRTLRDCGLVAGRAPEASRDRCEVSRGSGQLVPEGKEHVRSSYYLEDVATEFDVQGLELDWACVTWDADFRHDPKGWQHWSFVGDQWNRIRKAERQTYLKNAYRVLLTRARQGMVIVVPPGDSTDPTRDPVFYNPTFSYLTKIGFDLI